MNKIRTKQPSDVRGWFNFRDNNDYHNFQIVGYHCDLNLFPLQKNKAYFHCAYGGDEEGKKEMDAAIKFLEYHGIIYHKDETPIGENYWRREVKFGALHNVNMNGITNHAGELYIPE